MKWHSHLNKIKQPIDAAAKDKTLNNEELFDLMNFVRDHCRDIIKQCEAKSLPPITVEKESNV